MFTDTLTVSVKRL